MHCPQLLPSTLSAWEWCLQQIWSAMGAAAAALGPGSALGASLP